MARPELGTKRVCPTTGRKFYDMNRDPIVSPYTGEAVPRSAFEPLTRGPAPRAAAREEEDETEVAEGGAELISLEEADQAENASGDAASEDDVTIEGDEAAEEETFLEEEEEGGGDVSDLIDGDIEEDEES